MLKKRDDPEKLQAFVRLLTEHQGSIRAFIISLMPGSSEVGDVLQETNLTLWTKREQFEIGSNFLAWAFSVARYKVMHQLDRAKRSGKFVFSDEMIAALAEPEPEEESQEEYLVALERCVGKLNNDQRALIDYRYRDGHTLEEYAGHTGKSAGSLRIALLRVRQALRHCIEMSTSTRDSA